MNNKKMREKIEQLEAMITEIQNSVWEKERDDNERDYTRGRRKQMTTTVPDWVVDHCRNLLIEFNDKLQPFHYNKLTLSDLQRSLIYAMIRNPDDILFATYDEIKHLKE